MHSPAVRRKTPQGLSFGLHELVHVRDWVHRRGLILNILLDQVLDGAEFEELVLVRAPAPSCRAVSLWRTPAGVVAQAAGGQPRIFRGVRAALHHASAQLRAATPPRPSLWRNVVFGF